MGEPKWTQGEWHAFMGYLTSPDGKEYPTAEVLCDGRGIATVHWPLDDPEEFFANARVLAAAPDLYEALRSLVEAFEQIVPLNTDRVDYDAYKRAIAALSKARGEANE